MGSRDAATRMLDRMARIMTANIFDAYKFRLKHVSLTVVGGKVIAALNSADEHSLNEKQGQKEHEKFPSWKDVATENFVVDPTERRAIVDPTQSAKASEDLARDRARKGKDVSKVESLLSGDYGYHHRTVATLTNSPASEGRTGPGQVNVSQENIDSNLETIRSAFEHPSSIVWLKNVHATPEGEKRRKKKATDAIPEKKADIHAEMALLDQVEGEMARSSQTPESGTSIRPWPIAGLKLDCLACHWGFSLFNERVARKYGYEIISGGTSRILFNSWGVPQWMKKRPEVYQDFVKLVDREKSVDPKLKITEADAGGVSVIYLETGPGLGLMDPEDSDSEAEALPGARRRPSRRPRSPKLEKPELELSTNPRTSGSMPPRTLSSHPQSHTSSSSSPNSSSTSSDPNLREQKHE